MGLWFAQVSEFFNPRTSRQNIDSSFVEDDILKLNVAENKIAYGVFRVDAEKDIDVRQSKIGVKEADLVAQACKMKRKVQADARLSHPAFAACYGDRSAHSFSVIGQSAGIPEISSLPFLSSM